MKDKKIMYTIFSVLALAIVIVGIVFAWRSWNEEKDKEKEINNKTTAIY